MSLRPEENNVMLTEEEIDTLGEVGNMCMGAMATTMYALLDRRVEITTPRVAVLTTKDVLSMYPIPFVIVEVEYTEGISGKNLLLLKESDAAQITDILMGGEGAVPEQIELTDLHMSAINEIMNQMIGASATTLSKLLNRSVNISTPSSQRMTLDSDASGVLNPDEEVILITFDIEIEGLLNSQLVQIMPYEQGRTMSAALRSAAAVAPKPEPVQAPAAAVNAAYAEAAAAPRSRVDVRPMHYDAFTPAAVGAETAVGSLDFVYDIPLQVSVELGRTKKEISEILKFDMGTVIVLDKTAGDPVEILVNGRRVASGEVVVIDENYGVRITQLFN